MRTVLAFAVHIVNAGLLSGLAGYVSEQFMTHKRTYADIPRTAGGALVLLVLLGLMHALATKLSAARWTSIGPYTFFFACCLLLGAVDRPSLYAAACPGIAALLCWKLTARKAPAPAQAAAGAEP